MTSQAITTLELREDEANLIPSIQLWHFPELTRKPWLGEVVRGISFTFNLEPSTIGRIPDNILQFLEADSDTTTAIGYAIIPAEALITKAAMLAHASEPSVVMFEVFRNLSSFWRVSTKAGTGTTTHDATNDFLRRVAALFRSYEFASSDLEKGDLEKDLGALLLQGGNIVLHSIDLILKERRVDGEVASDALRLLGKFRHSATGAARLRLLTKHLDHPSRWVRDGAALGLASLEEKSALPALRAAVLKEQIPDLKSDILRAVKYLETTSK